MTVAVFLLLALVVTGIIVYPLLPGRVPIQPKPAVTDEDIERAVRDLRRARIRGGHLCPACGQAYLAGDRFCVRCGSSLSQTALESSVCPTCGAAVHQGDLFCAKCGHRMSTGEAV